MRDRPAITKDLAGPIACRLPDRKLRQGPPDVVVFPPDILDSVYAHSPRIFSA